MTLLTPDQSSCVDLSQTGCASKFNVSCICASAQWINYLACCVSQKCDPADQNGAPPLDR